MSMQQEVTFRTIRLFDLTVTTFIRKSYVDILFKGYETGRDRRRDYPPRG